MKESRTIGAGDVPAPTNGPLETEKRFGDDVAPTLINGHLTLAARPMDALRGRRSALGVEETRSPRELVLQ
jgi:hypothetical protein